MSEKPLTAGELLLMEAKKVPEKQIEKELLEFPDVPTLFPTPAKMKWYDEIIKLMIAGDLLKNPNAKTKARIKLQIMICEALGIPAVFFRGVVIVEGGYELDTKLMAWMIAQAEREGKIQPTVECVRADSKVCIYRMKRNPEDSWQSFKHTIEGEKKLNRNFNSNPHWKNEEGHSYMLRSRTLGEGYRTVFPIEIRGAGYVKGELGKEEAGH